MRENIYDNFGKIIGFIEKIGNETYIKDSLGRILGKHLVNTDEVFDVLGRRIGKGISLLGTLLKK